MVTSFTNFPDLPLELQRMIWREATRAIQPRTIYLQHWPLKANASQRVWSNKAIGDDDEAFFNSPAVPRRWLSAPIKASELEIPRDDLSKGFRCLTTSPRLMFACWEAYQAFKCDYRLAFGTAHSLPETWIDFKKDTLFMNIHMRCLLTGQIPCDDAITKEDLATREFQQVEAVVIDHYRGIHPQSFTGSVAVIMDCFPGAKRVVLPDRQFERDSEVMDITEMDEGLVANVQEAIDGYAGKRDSDIDIDQLQDQRNARYRETQVHQNFDTLQTTMDKHFKDQGLESKKVPTFAYATFVERSKKALYKRMKRRYGAGMREKIRRNCESNCACPPTRKRLKMDSGPALEDVIDFGYSG